LIAQDLLVGREDWAILITLITSLLYLPSHAFATKATREPPWLQMDNPTLQAGSLGRTQTKPTTIQVALNGVVHENFYPLPTVKYRTRTAHTR
jgi:hypothetical protein